PSLAVRKASQEPSRRSLKRRARPRRWPAGLPNPQPSRCTPATGVRGPSWSPRPRASTTPFSCSERHPPAFFVSTAGRRDSCLTRTTGPTPRRSRSRRVSAPISFFDSVSCGTVAVFEDLYGNLRDVIGSGPEVPPRRRYRIPARSKGGVVIRHLATVVLALLISLPVFAQQSSAAPKADKPAENTDILLAKVQADKKLLVAQNMGLTETEAKNFWPVYESYQKDLAAINKRMVETVQSFADAFAAGPVSDDMAKKLTDQYLGVEQDEVNI